MRNYTVSDRLKFIMAKKGYKQIDIVNKAQQAAKIFNEQNKTNIKFGRNDISQYVAGKVEPNQYKLECLATALNVNPVWLMGYDVGIDCPYEVITEKEFDEAAINVLYKEILMKTSSIDDNTKLKSLLKGLINKLEDFINSLK